MVMRLKDIHKKNLIAYAEEAYQYDRKRFRSFEGRFFHERSVDLLLKNLPSVYDLRILDVAAGTGRFSVELAKYAKVTSLDLTSNMLGIAKEKAKTSNGNSIDFVLANAQRLPFAEKTFDCVVSIRFLHLIPSRYYHHFIDEMKRVLKPSGILMFELDNPLLFGIFYGILKDVLIRRFVLKKSITSFLFPSRIKAYLRGMTNTRVLGFWLPGMSKIARANLDAACSLSHACQKFPLNYLSSPILVVSKKQ